MFCPKCGTKLPETAVFCTKCGHSLPKRANIETAGSGPAIAQVLSTAQESTTAQTSTFKSFNLIGIASRACAVIAIVGMLLPWLEVPGLQSLKGYASMVGINVSSSFSYHMFNMGEVTKTLDFLSNSNAFSAIQMGFLIFWGIALILLVIGLVHSAIGNKSTSSLLFGGFAAALVAFIWFAAVMYLDGEYSRQVAQLIGSKVQFFSVPPAVGVTFFAGLAAGILGMVGKKKNT